MLIHKVEYGSFMLIAFYWTMLFYLLPFHSLILRAEYSIVLGWFCLFLTVTFMHWQCTFINWSLVEYNAIVIIVLLYYSRAL